MSTVLASVAPSYFERKSDGEAWLVETRHDVARGLHTPSAYRPRSKKLGALWIKRCNEKKLEQSTIRAYEEHCNLHIFPSSAPRGSLS